jgi:phage shock protein A
MFYFIILIAIVAISLFLFNARFQYWIKSMFNKNMDAVENKQDLLNQANLELSKKQAETNLAQAKIVAQMNSLKGKQQELQDDVDEQKDVLQKLKDRHETETDATQKNSIMEAAKAVAESIGPTIEQLEKITKQIEGLTPNYEKALEMAEIARDTYNQQKQDIQTAKMKNTFSQASKNIADSVAVFDSNQVGINTSDILDKVNQETAENDAKLEVAMQTKSIDIGKAKAKKILKESKDPFAILN